MASRNIPLPYFPTPPREYNPQVFADFLRAFALYMQQVQNPGEARATFMVFTALQQNDYGLEPGAVFQVDGALRVSVPNKPYPAGVQATGGVGQITKAP